MMESMSSKSIKSAFSKMDSISGGLSTIKNTDSRCKNVIRMRSDEVDEEIKENPKKRVSFSLNFYQIKLSIIASEYEPSDSHMSVNKIPENQSIST